MVTRRRFSKEVHKGRIARREDLERTICSEILNIIDQHLPDARLPAAQLASTLASVIASQIVVQSDATQRALKSIEDEGSEYATDFVNGLLDRVNKNVNQRLAKFRARLPAVKPEARLQLADDWAGPVAGPTEIERFFGIPRSTLYRWQKLNEVIAIHTRTSRKPVFPLRQFVDGRPVKGITEVISIFGDQRAAWLWLITSNSEFGGQSGLDFLLQGKTAIVTAGALKPDALRGR